MLCQARVRHSVRWAAPPHPISPRAPGLLPPPRPLSSAPGAGLPQRGAQPAGASGKQEAIPFQQKILNSFLNISSVPYSSYVPYPITPLHRVDAMVKQLWLVALYLVIARSAPVLRWGIAGGIALLTAACLPRRLWESQLRRLLFICAAIFLFTAIGSDGVPPVLQPRNPPPALLALPPLPAAPTGYSYVILHLWFITITHRSVNLAITASTLSFTALQSASLCLTTTPAEEMAMALKAWLSPLRLLGVPTQKVALQLLLSLRFMSLVFEEIRNLCLGLAARGVDWRQQGSGGSLSILGRLCVRLFANLFNRAENISQAMVARGFQGPEAHRLYLMRCNDTSWAANLAALALLGAIFAAAAYIK